MKRLSILFAVGIAALGVRADRVELLSPDSVEVEEAFIANAPDGEDAVPRYLIFGNSWFAAGVGGHAKATVGEDFRASRMDPNCFMPSDIPVPSSSRNRDFNASLQQTSLFLNAVAFPDDANRIGVYVGFNFLGTNYLPKLVAAYARYRGFTIGYNYNVFCDNATMPALVDYQGPNSATVIQTPQITWDMSFGSRRQWKVMAGIMVPQTSLTYSLSTERARKCAPDMAASIRYYWGNGGEVQAGALLRSLSYRNQLSGNRITRAGGGFMVNGLVPIVGGLSLGFNGVWGRGIASYIQDLSGLGYDMMPDGERLGRLKLVETWGAYGYLRYDIGDRFTLTGVYSQVRNYLPRYVGGDLTGNDDTMMIWEEKYRYGQYIAGNFSWHIRDYLTVAMEYIYGRRVDNSGRQSHATRLQAAATFWF